MTLDAIARAANAAQDATARLRSLVADAMETREVSGITVAEITAAADITRQTAYRWSADREHGKPYANPVTAMDDALQILGAAQVGPNHEVLAGLRTNDKTAKARRVMLVSGNMSPSHDLSEEDKQIIGVGCIAAHNVLDKSGQSRRLSQENQRKCD